MFLNLKKDDIIMSTTYFELANDEDLQSVFKDVPDFWIDTPFENYVNARNNKEKGEFGELHYTKIAEHLGHLVVDPPTSTEGYDRIIDGYKTEIKYSLAQPNKKKTHIVTDTFIINHAATFKDWERLVFVGINLDPKKMRVGWISKKDFVYMTENKLFFRRGQGGEKNPTDDWMCTGGNVKKLIKSEYFKPISSWKNDNEEDDEV